MGLSTYASSIAPINRYNTSAIFTSVIIEMKEVGNVQVAVFALITENSLTEWLRIYGEFAVRWEINQMISNYAGPKRIKRLVSQVFRDYFQTVLQAPPIVSRRFSV